MSSQALEFEVKKPNGSEALAVPTTPFELMAQAIQQGISAEQLKILQEMHFRQLEFQAEIEFNEALSRVAKRVERVIPDLHNSQTNSDFPSQVALDRAIRPLYVAEDFSLSFNTVECPKPDMVRVVGYLSRGAHTREYQHDVPADGKGPKGGDVMSKTHASGAALTYGRRYLTCAIFNIPVGPNTDGNSGGGLDDVSERIEFIQNCRTFDELKGVFKSGYTAAKEAKDNRAEKQIVAAYEARKKELNANR